MKKKICLFTVVLLTVINIWAQEKKLYDPDANATADIEAAVKKAAAENKYVLIQAGGNWCSWCLEFARSSKADLQIDSAINSGFIWYHLNYSKENMNDAGFAKYGSPQRCGVPVVIILDGKGQRLNTQNSEYLEDGKKSYDKNKVLSFLANWSPKALLPETYEKQ